MTEFEKNIGAFNQQLSPTAVILTNSEQLVGQQPDSIIICGMGGSGLAGRLLTLMAPAIGLTVPILTWSDYDLPPHPFKNPFLIFVSFSGTTAETIASFAAAPPTALRAVVAADGKLRQLAETHRLPLAIFSAGTLQPRQATGVTLYALLGLLKQVFPNLTVADYRHRFDPLLQRPQGEALAAQLARKIVLIYTSSTNAPLAYNWKDRLNETGKALAFWNVIPEMCHNEIVPLTLTPSNLAVLFLTDPHDHPENKKRFQLVEQLLRERSVAIQTLAYSDADIFEKIFQSINLADWTAFFLAREQGVDPADITIIDQLKQLMS